MFSLEGKTCVVTGAGKGIGRGLRLGFVRGGKGRVGVDEELGGGQGGEGYEEFSVRGDLHARMTWGTARTSTRVSTQHAEACATEEG